MPTENQNADPATSLAAVHDLNQWKLVPVEPTETMVINGFESEPDECFSDEEVWEQHQEMSGCQQAAFRAKLCWAAMLAAAPVPPQTDLDRVVAERDALQALLTAADERADVLETALKKINARCVAYIEAEREMPEPSVEVCQMIASAALKPAEANDSCEFCKGWGFRTNPDGADEGCGACGGTGEEQSDDQP